MRTVSNGARALATAHGLSVEALEAECTEQLITKGVVQAHLVRQGVLAPAEPAEKQQRRTAELRAPAKAEAKAKAKAKVTMAPQQAATDTPFKDPLLLDGSTIAVTWPCGIDGELALVGRVAFNAKGSIRKMGKRKGRKP